MKPLNRIVIALVSAIFLFPALVFAQMSGGMGQGMRMQMPKYDPSTVVTVKGTVEEVQTGMMRSGQMGGMMQSGQMGQGRMGGPLRLTLKTDTGSFNVLVGPARFVKEKNFTFAKGDQISVTGSKVKFNGSEAIIAREIKKGDKTLTLRDEKGVPAWPMGRGRQP
jgi:hypothetical protein